MFHFYSHPVVETEKKGVILTSKEFKKTVEAEKHIYLPKRLEYLETYTSLKVLQGLDIVML